MIPTCMTLMRRAQVSSQRTTAHYSNLPTSEAQNEQNSQVIDCVGRDSSSTRFLARGPHAEGSVRVRAV